MEPHWYGTITVFFGKENVYLLQILRRASWFDVGEPMLNWKVMNTNDVHNLCSEAKRHLLKYLGAISKESN